MEFRIWFTFERECVESGQRASWRSRDDVCFTPSFSTGNIWKHLSQFYTTKWEEGNNQDDNGQTSFIYNAAPYADTISAHFESEDIWMYMIRKDIANDILAEMLVAVDDGMILRCLKDLILQFDTLRTHLTDSCRKWFNIVQSKI